MSIFPNPNFSDDENFAASVSLDYVPNPDADYYTISFDKKGNPSIKAVPLHLLPTDSTTSVRNFPPTSMYVSLDESVRLEMLLSCWKKFYASFDKSVQQEMLLCCWKQFYARIDKSVQ